MRCVRAGQGERALLQRSERATDEGQAAVEDVFFPFSFDDNEESEKRRVCFNSFENRPAASLSLSFFFVSHLSFYLFFRSFVFF